MALLRARRTPISLAGVLTKPLNTLLNVMGIESDWFGVAEGGGGETMQGGVYDELLV